MMKTLRSIFFVASLTLLAPNALQAAEMSEPLSDVEMSAMENASEIKVEVKGRKLRVQGAHGETVEVFSLTGKKMLSAAISAGDETLSLNALPRGCYIVKVGNLVRKISVL